METIKLTIRFGNVLSHTHTFWVAFSNIEQILFLSSLSRGGGNGDVKI